MRRPVLYLAGLLLATGASLALAGPASAAPNGHHCDRHYSNFYDDDEYYNDYPDSYSSSFDFDSNHHNSAIGLIAVNDVLNGGNFNSGGLFGGGLL